MPRFYPNAVTLDARRGRHRRAAPDRRILQKSNLPGRWAVKDSFNTLDIARLGFDVLFEASWIRKVDARDGHAGLGLCLGAR